MGSNNGLRPLRVGAGGDRDYFYRRHLSADHSLAIRMGLAHGRPSRCICNLLGIYATLGVFLLRAARNPLQNLSLIWFTVWSSVVHGTIMAAQALAYPEHRGHLLGDAPALLVIAIMLAVLTLRTARASVPAAEHLKLTWRRGRLLTQECGWKGGDRGGSAARGMEGPKRERYSLLTWAGLLMVNRPILIRSATKNGSSRVLLLSF